jgi:predicted nucleic acid-binding protein
VTVDFLLDTDICIYALKRRSRQLAAHDGRMAISDVSLLELSYGAEGYAEPQRRHRAQQEAMTASSPIPSGRCFMPLPKVLAIAASQSSSRRALILD